LPVICDFEIITTTKIDDFMPSFVINVENPIREKLSMQVFTENEQVFQFEIFTMDGRRIDQFSEYISAGNNTLSRRFDVAPSLYILKITNERRETIVKKLIK